MFFTNASRMIAWLLLALGLAWLGVMAYLKVLENEGRAPPQFLEPLRSQTSEEAVLTAVLGIGFALVLGVLTEISRSFIRR